MAREGYDEQGRYVGPCPECGTAHDGWYGPETMGGKLQCIRIRAAASGDDALLAEVEMTGDMVRLMQLSALGVPLTPADL